MHNVSIKKIASLTLRQKASIVHKVNKSFPFLLFYTMVSHCETGYYTSTLHMGTERHTFKLYRKLENEKCNFSFPSDSYFFCPKLTTVAVSVLSFYYQSASMKLLNNILQILHLVSNFSCEQRKNKIQPSAA